MPASKNLFRLVAALAVSGLFPPFARASTPAAPALVIDAGMHMTVATGTQLVTSVNVLNSGTFTPALGSGLVVTGSASPLLQGLTDFADLTMAHTGTATLGTPATVWGVLNLSSGNLSLAGHELLVSGILGGSAGSYVVTPDTLGRLAQSITQYAPMLFPVGNSTYDPISIQTATGTDRAYVAVTDLPPAGGLPVGAALNRAWLVRQLNFQGADGPLTLSLQWNDGEQGPHFDRSFGQLTSAQAYRWYDAAWVPEPGARVSENGPSANPAVDVVSTQKMGLWTLASPAVLAVDPPGASGSPRSLELAQNSPNPCVRGTTIRYGLPRRAGVSLAVYSLLGERVATLAEGEQEPGYHVARFDPGRLPGGIYFYRLAVQREVLSRKLIVVR